MDVSSVDDGVYYLVVAADPSQTYAESERNNNRTWLKVELKKAAGAVRLLALNEVLVTVIGEAVVYPAPARLIADRAFVPAGVAERLGARVEQTGAQVVITTGATRLEFTAGSSTALVNGEVEAADTEALPPASDGASAPASVWIGIYPGPSADGTGIGAHTPQQGLTPRPDSEA